MARLSTQQRARLIKALEGGATSHVTHRARREGEGEIDDFHRFEQLCLDGYLRLKRIRGDRFDPSGERTYEYQLTDKGRREALRS